MARDMAQQRSRSKTFLRMAADFLWPPRSLISRERGLGKGPLAPHEFGQIHFLSGAVCDRCGTPLGLVPDEGATEGGLSANARRRNLAGAFALRPSCAGHDEGKRMLLVDDVLTTGRR